MMVPDDVQRNNSQKARSRFKSEEILKGLLEFV